MYVAARSVSRLFAGVHLTTTMLFFTRGYPDAASDNL